MQLYLFRNLATVSGIFLCFSYLLFFSTLEKAKFRSKLYQSSDEKMIGRKNLTNKQSKSHNNDSIGCRLQIPDPWHPSVRGLFWNSFRDHSLPIPKNTRLLTNFSDGILRKIHSAYSCQYRCYTLNAKDEIEFGEWILFEKEANISCAYIDVSCDQNKNQMRKHSTYHITYTQAVKKKNMTKRSDAPYRPSVIIIIVDSMSHSTAKRRLPKTLQFLHDNLDIVEFDGHAKVGQNSNPNAAAFLAGIMPETSDEEWGEDSSGDRAQKKSIWNDFSQQGYVTYFSEDSIHYELFGRKRNPPFDHSLFPFWKNADQFKAALPSSNHHISLNNLNEFLNIYQHNQLFALNWIVDLAHGQANDLDDHFFQSFFNRSQGFLKDSFLFFMGDHGLRFGELRSTEIGRMEDSLPFLSIAIPERFRKKRKLVSNLENNSKILTSHFDIHVTLWDILTTDFKDFSRQLEWRNFTSSVRGQSLLRPINNRTCKTARVPLQYCPCEGGPTNLVENKDLSLKIANQTIEWINKYIPLHMCRKVYLEGVIEMRELVGQAIGDSKMYRIKMKLQPNNGIFEVLFLHNEKSGEIQRKGEIDRINAYGRLSSCVHGSLYAPYCRCK